MEVGITATTGRLMLVSVNSRFLSVHPGSGSGWQAVSGWVAKLMSSTWSTASILPDAISCRTSFTLSTHGSPFASLHVGWSPRSPASRAFIAAL